MSHPNMFNVFLRSLPADQIACHVTDDGQHVLGITAGIQFCVQPDEDNVPAAIDGLRKLAATASEMAGALNRHGGA